MEPWKKVEKSQRHVSKREERESSEKRSGSAAQSTNKWTYSAVLSFLDPCITPRETSGNMGRRGGGPWKSGPQSPERRREQGQQQGVSQGSRQCSRDSLQTPLWYSGTKGEFSR
ncbi:hypothetical protein EYF80_014810 [Liparis tanakae]|uniref:Uncharacterized protein n=1 Tax=Liparis tanakae TaxID=230148 RepID=A0A4Z2IBV2_9TELE|nr:hypothetical protein EYF80_014810 [Liparis tanakae]